MLGLGLHVWGMGRRRRTPGILKWEYRLGILYCNECLLPQQALPVGCVYRDSSLPIARLAGDVDLIRPALAANSLCALVIADNPEAHRLFKHEHCVQNVVVWRTYGWWHGWRWGPRVFGEA